MTTMTVPVKEFRESIKIQKSILSRLDFLQKIVFETSKDEIDSRLIKRYEKISTDLDQGKGKKFHSVSAFKTYLKDL